jgi:predicted TIM-barrel fold metal-dependent hydrolase
MIIDIHAHLTPDLYLALCETLGGSFENRYTGHPDPVGLEERFVLMAEAGVGRQILSPTTAPYGANETEGVAAARLINDHFAAVCDDNPQHLSFWASLPLPHVDSSLAELARGMDELGAVGVALGCFCLGESIASRAFEPVYAELNRRNAIVFLHPCQNGICSHHVNDWGLTVCAGASLEDSLAAMHLIAAGIPGRYPGIEFIVPHFGGIMPMLLNRLDGQMPQADLVEKPSVTARRFHYDTVGWGSRAALLAAVEAFGAGQIVTGSDYPVLLRHESYKQTFDNVRHSGLPSHVVEQILGNAERLLGRAAAIAGDGA